MSSEGSSGNVIAAVCSVFLPGLGQLVQGRIGGALLFFVVTSVGYGLSFLILPAIIAFPVHIWSIVDAARHKS